MKKIIISIVAVIMALPMIAQNEQCYKKNNSEETRTDKVLSIIKERNVLSESEFDAFAPIFKEYTAKRALLNKEKREARNVNENTTEDQAKEMLLKLNECDVKKAELKKEYTEKMLKVVPAKKLLELQALQAKYRAHRMHNCQNPDKCNKMGCPNGQKPCQKAENCNKTDK